MTTPFTSSPDLDVEVAVIGAGIGGLSTVLALQEAGVDAHAFERAPALAPLGAAIIVRVQSLELLERWADMDFYNSRACRVDTMEFATAEGVPLRSTPLIGEPDDPDWGHSVHRADLFEALRRALPDGTLHLGRETATVVDRGDHVEVRFTDGGKIRARTVIGADGIRSTVRETLFGREDPVFSGMINCRTVMPAEVLGDLPNDRIRMWLHDDCGFALFPVSGGREIAYDAALWSRHAGEESWSTTISTEEVLSHLGGFLPLVGDVVRAGTRAITAFSTYDRDPIPRWTVGRMTLLGDAAHPMLPFQGQGANQAIQDAAILAGQLAPALRGGGDVHEALKAYEEIRRPRTAHFQTKSRKLPQQTERTAAQA